MESRRRIYLDNNIYAFLQAEAITPELARDFFDAHGLAVVGSQVNLLEIHQIADSSLRTARFRLVGSCVSESLEPEGYVWSNEILAQVRKHRPNWLQERPDTSRISTFLNAARRRWIVARNESVEMPTWGATPTTLKGIRRSTRDNQKAIRHATRGAQQDANAVPLALITPAGEISLEPTIENQVRVRLIGMWSLALFDRTNPMKDLRDFLGVYLVRDPDQDEWRTFWLDDLELNQVPHCRLHAAAQLFQLGHKPETGNSADAGHATHLLDADEFLTCDEDFFAVLRKARGLFEIDCNPRLIPRSESDPLIALGRALDLRREDRD